MRLHKYLLFLLGALLSMGAMAFDPFVVKDIRIEGIQRTEAGTVFSYLPVKVGDTMTEEMATQSIRSLFATGFFRDVTLEVDNGVLIVTVQERPSVAQIDVTGSKILNKEDVIKGLRASGLAEGRVFDRGLLERAEQELKRLYIGRGRYSAQVTSTVTPVERNRVSVRIDIVEGDVAKIRQISVIGGRAFRESELISLFKLSTPGLMTWYSNNDQYSRPKLSADLETLRSHYLDRGYLEFNIDSTQVSITPDKKDVYITIGITEGPQYTISEVKVAGEMLIPEAEVLRRITLKQGEIFSRTKLNESVKAINDRLGDDGYAFANVNAVPDLDREKRRASFTFFVDPGRRVYVRRINVSGNTRTRDEVVRRELRQLEGGWYSSEAIRRSRQRVDRLGYFDDVNVETPAVTGTTDQVDVNVSVKEKATGNMLFGVGYSDSDGVLLNASVSQQNVFGSGNFLGVQVNTSRVNTVYSLSFTQPYWTVDGVARGFDLYKKNVDPTSINAGLYSTSTLGGQVRLGVPLTDIDTVQFGLGYESTTLETFTDSPKRILDHVATFGTHNTSVLGSVNWARDTRDSAIYPTSGGTQRLSLESGLPGGELQFYKLGYQNQRYFPLSRDFTLYLNGDIGFADGMAGKPLPFFRNYYAGGSGSVRGFRSSTIGPKDANDEPVGGNRKLVGNAEILFPFPGLRNERSMRVSTFVDAGLVGQSYSIDDMRTSAGVSWWWLSPFGPLKLSYAKAFRTQVNDRTERLQFTFGSQF